MPRPKTIIQVCNKLFHHAYEKCMYYKMTGHAVNCCGEVGKEYAVEEKCFECPKLDERSKRMYRMLGKIYSQGRKKKNGS